jgi:SAM-dependent methyltransferase
MSIEPARPHISRIYDYVLGGTYNFEADRKAAEAILDLVPAYPRWARLNRSFLGRVGQLWAAAGRTRVLDLGSGLTTQGHFNEHLPGARILFTDSDELTVEQGRQILAGVPGMDYVKADLRDPAALLAQAAPFFGDDRRLAVGCIGVAYFLSDDALAALMRQLHAFCAPGSVLALTFHEVPEGPEHEAILAALVESARLARIEFYVRTAEHVAELCAPWRTVATQRLGSWLDEQTPAPVPVRPEHPMHKATIHGAFAEH